MYRLILSEHDVIIVVTAKQQEGCQSIQRIDYVKKNDPILLNINWFWNLRIFGQTGKSMGGNYIGTTNLKETNIFVGPSFFSEVVLFHFICPEQIEKLPKNHFDHMISDFSSRTSTPSYSYPTSTLSPVYKGENRSLKTL